MKKAKKLSVTLPQEVIFWEILTRLPVKSLVRFRCVSKRWHTLLATDPDFVNEQLIRTLENYNSHSGHGYIFKENLMKQIILSTVYGVRKSVLGVVVVGSCNGLICLTDEAIPSHPSPRISKPFQTIYIWNPAIRQCKSLQLLATKGNNNGLAFGFDRIKNDYKLVRLTGAGDMTYVDIYSLISNSWRKLENIPYLLEVKYSMSLRHIRYPRSDIDGYVHWLGRSSGHRGCDTNLMIISFDMSNEVFQEIPLPLGITLNLRSMYLRRFMENLAIFAVYRNQVIHVWVMNDYHHKKSWDLLYSIEGDPHRILIPHNSKYNPELLKDSDLLCQFGYELLYYDVVPYVESLVPITTTHDSTDTQLELPTHVMLDGDDKEKPYPLDGVRVASAIEAYVLGWEFRITGPVCSGKATGLKQGFRSSLFSRHPAW